jgi:hypothetical protein
MFGFPKLSFQGFAPTIADILTSLFTGGFGAQSLASAGTSETIPASQMVGPNTGWYVRSGGSTTTATTDTAANIVAQAGVNAYVGQTFLFVYSNLNSGTATLAAGTGVTLQGTTTVATVTSRAFAVTITSITPGSQAVTVQGIVGGITTTA